MKQSTRDIYRMYESRAANELMYFIEHYLDDETEKKRKTKEFHIWNRLLRKKFKDEETYLSFVEVWYSAA